MYYGMAVGDAYGAPLETMTAQKIEETLQEIHKNQPALGTIFNPYLPPSLNELLPPTHNRGILIDFWIQSQDPHESRNVD